MPLVVAAAAALALAIVAFMLAWRRHIERPGPRLDPGLQRLHCTNCGQPMIPSAYGWWHVGVAGNYCGQDAARPGPLA